MDHVKIHMYFNKLTKPINMNTEYNECPHDSVERYTNLGVDVVKGYAKLIDPWTVEIKLNDGGTQTLTARTLVIATGARPLLPPLPGIEETEFAGQWSSNAACLMLGKTDAQKEKEPRTT